jgi:hypothetical protein
MTLAEELAQIDSDIERLEQRRRDIYKLSLEAPAEEKVCEDVVAEMCSEAPLFPSMPYPITISHINWVQDESNPFWRRGEPKLVAVRPVGDERTYLGVHMGDLHGGCSATYHAESGVLSLEYTSHNPAIVVPSLKRIVMGRESWWGEIKSEADLRQITDKDIDNVWYVQALRKMVEGE